MLTTAQNGSKEIKSASEKYVDHLLTDVETYLQNGLQEVKQTKSRIEGVKK